MLFDVLKVFKVLTDETINLVMPPGADATAVAAPADEPADEPADATTTATPPATPPATPTAATTDAASLLRTTPGTTITKRLNTIKNIMAVLVEHLDDNKLTETIGALDAQLNTYTQKLADFESSIDGQFTIAIKEAKEELDKSQKDIESRVSTLNDTILSEHGSIEEVREALIKEIKSLNESLGDLNTYDTDEIKDAAGNIDDLDIRRRVIDSLTGGKKSRRKTKKKYSRRL